MSGASVLLVEDDVTSASALRAILTRRGCQVRAVETVRDALAALAPDAPAPDWLLLDLMLPDGDGIDVLRLVRDRGLPTRVIITTAAHDPERLQAVRDLHPHELMRKPIDLMQLLGVLGLT